MPNIAKMSEQKTTAKKNQHFVPRFHLKRFSVFGNENEIRMFEKKNEQFIASTSLKNQASEKYYYGKDGELEDDLSVSEGIFAETIKSVLSTEKLPAYFSKEHRTLLHFTVSTEFRNPIKKEAMERLTDIIGEYAKKHVNFPDEYRNSDSKLKLKDPVSFTLSNHNQSVLMISDLHLKLLKNITAIPFITSDNPVVHYNQFLEQHTKLQAITGYGMMGIQIFVPLSPAYMLMLYDSQVYYIGKRKSKTVVLSDPSEIDQLNLIQFMNAKKICFGNENTSEDLFRKLLVRSRSLPIPRQPIFKRIKTGEQTFTEYHAESSCRTNLRLSFVAYSTFASRVKFEDNALFYPRAFALQMADAIRNDPHFRDFHDAST